MVSGARCWGYETWRVAPLSLLVPVVGMASAALLLGETLSGLQLAGAALIMAGLYINAFSVCVWCGLAWRAGKKKPRRRGYTQVCV